MVRISKQGRKRSKNPKRPSSSLGKTGSKRDRLPLGFKERKNAIEGEEASMMFIPKIGKRV